MAESYRGLTIRIGGDTSSLTKALKAANQASTQTQAELRKVSQALKFDPSSVEAYTVQVGYLANQATNTAMKLRQLHDAQDQLAKTKIKIGIGLDDEENQIDIKQTIQSIIEEAKKLDGLGENDILNAAQKAASARAEFNQLTNSLSAMHTEVTKLSADAAKVETEKLRKAFDVSEGKKSIAEAKEELAEMFDGLPESKLKKIFEQLESRAKAFDFKHMFNLESSEDIAKELNKQFESMPQHLKPSSDAVAKVSDQIRSMRVEYDKVVAKLAEVNKKREEALSANDGKENAMTKQYASQIANIESNLTDMFSNIKDEYASMMEDLTSITGTVFKFDNDNTNPEVIRTALQEIAEDLNLDIAKVDQFADEVARLQELFIQADTDLKKWIVIEEFQDLAVEITKGEAQLVNFSKVLQSMSAPSSLMQGMSELTANIQMLDDAYSKLMANGKAIEETVKVDPTNLQAVNAAMNTYAAAALVATEESRRLQEELDSFSAAGIKPVNDSVVSASQRLFEATEAAQKASQELATVEGAIAHYETRLKELEGTNSESLTSEEEMKRKRKENAEAIDFVNGKLDEYKAKQKEARAAEKEANANADEARKQKEYEDLAAKVEAYKAKVIEAYEAEVRLANVEAIKEKFGDTGEIDDLIKKLNDAKERLDSLSEMASISPDGIDVVSARMQALAEYEGIVRDVTREIQERMEKFNTGIIDDLQKKYGSVAEAVKKTSDAAKENNAKLDEAKVRFHELVHAANLDDVEQDILNMSSDVDSKLTPAIIEARDAVISYGKAAKDAMDESNVAAQADEYQKFVGRLADANKTKSTGGLDEAAFQQALSRMSQYAEQAGRQIVESANTIDSAYRDMRKTVNGTEEDFEALKKSAIEFSQTNAVSADTILEMESLGGQLGIAVSRLQEFGEVASHLDIATDIGAEDIALQMGQLKNIMSDFDDSNFVNFADALVRLGNNTATTESAIMNVAQRMAAVANVTSMTTPELLAWSAAIASTGQRSESAATSITRTITGIGQAVSEGGASLQQFAKIAGMSAEEFEDKWRNSSSEALEAFVKGLGTLTDDSTEAIAALDAVGISSVRQETALLALSQTIGNLDASLEHATVGWNNSGDAAREAGEKSKGFSGALQILKNNAADFAESFGDGMVAPMQAASSALGVLTDLLNVIPGPIKTVMVSIAGLGTAVGTTYPMFSTLTEKMSDSGLTLKYLPTLMSATAQGADGMKEALLAAGVSAEEAGKMVTAFGTALKATGIGLAITAGLALVGEIVKAYQDWAEHEDLVKNATTGLTESLGAAASAYDEYAESLQKTSMTYQEVHDATESTLKSVAAFSETIGETLSTVGENSAAAEHYGEIIKELGNKGRISGDDLSTLNNAIDQYNSITGSSIEVTDAVTGALNILSPAIDAVTEAYERQAEQQAYYELYNEAIKEQAKVKVELQQIDEELSDAEKDLGDSFWSAFDYEGLTRVNQLKESQEELQASMESLTDTSDSLKDMIGDTAYEFPDLETALVAAGGSLDDFGSLTDEEKDKLREIEAALNQAGSSLYNYGALNSSQLSAIAAAWNGSAGDIVASINKIKKETESVSSSVQKASDAAVTALKRAQEDAYTAMKRQLDDEYDSLKKSLDSQYNARKKELDNEYKAAKSASDKWLKEFKKAQEAEVDAFKEATDAKLAEMEKEYEYKKKLLDDEYSGYDSEIQSKIDAIKAEQTAEDDAKKQQERQEKLSELQLEVQRAKTRKKRQEAEKKLNEYLEEIRAEDTKAAREAEIDKLEDQRDALKDQLSERQNTLKESYDLAVNEYKSEREAILKLMKEAQEAEYDAQKEAQEAQLQSMKDSHDAELEALKAHNEEILKEKKRANEDALTALKREQEDALNALKKGYEEIEKETEEAAEKVAESTHKIAEESKLSLNDILKSLAENGRIHLDTYLGYMNQMPGSVREIFDQLGLTVDNGLGEVARIMLENGDITLQQYLAIMSQMPGSTTAICSETGLQIAEQLGLLGNDVTNAATGIVTTVEENTRDVANITTQRGVEAGMGLASLGGQETVDTAARNSQTLRDALETPFSNIGEAGEAAGSSWNVGLTNGFNKDADKPIQSAHDVAEATVKQMDISDSTKTLGSNAAIGWNNGWVPGANKALDNVTAWASSVISAITKTHLIHSPSRKFKWLAEMDMKGFEEGWNLGARSVEKSVQKTSNSLLDAMSEGDYDITQSIIDSMKAREDDLRNQAERMARIIEDGFDPTLTVDAAYEAIDRIDEGKYRRQQLMADKYPQQATTSAITINLNVSEVVVREEADIDLIAQKLAVRVNRSIGSRIG